MYKVVSEKSVPTTFSVKKIAPPRFCSGAKNFTLTLMDEGWTCMHLSIFLNIKKEKLSSFSFGLP